MTQTEQRIYEVSPLIQVSKFLNELDGKVLLLKGEVGKAMQEALSSTILIGAVVSHEFDESFVVDMKYTTKASTHKIISRFYVKTLERQGDFRVVEVRRIARWND